MGKTNVLLNLINNQTDIDKINLYAKGPYQAKYQYLIKKREKVGLDHFNDPKAFIEYSNDMQDVYKSIEEYKLDYLSEAENLIFQLFLLHNHILKYLKMLDCNKSFIRCWL